MLDVNDSARLSISLATAVLLKLLLDATLWLKRLIRVSFGKRDGTRWTILTLVVPRTIESSMRTMRLPATSAELALCLSLTPRWRMPSLGSIKVRPT